MELQLHAVLMSIRKQKLFILPHSKALLFGWFSLLVLIICLSVFGRSLQTSSKQWLPDSNLAAAFIAVTSLLCVLSMHWASKKQVARIYWQLLWLIPLFVIYPLTLPIVEERLHFILFGSFGFASLLLFRPVWGLMVCCLMAGGDELLQWFLPTRVGDWRDVGFNLLAGLGGAAFALLVRYRAPCQGADSAA